MFLWIIVPAIIISLLFFYDGLKSFKNLNEHPILKNLSNYGNPLDIAKDIDLELKNKENNMFIPHMSIIITDNWFLQYSSFGVDITKVSDILWIYKKVTKRSVNFIPTGSSEEMVFHTNINAFTILECGDQDFQDIIKMLMIKNPKLLVGWNEELFNIWENDISKFQNLIHTR